MKYVKTLIDRAAEVCGSRYKLAKRIGVPTSNLSNMDTGKRPVPALVAVKLAVVAGLDPRDALVACVLQSAKDDAEREELAKAFFPDGDAALSDSSSAAPSSDSSARSTAHALAVFAAIAALLACGHSEVAAQSKARYQTDSVTLYIMSNLRIGLFRLLNLLGVSFGPGSMPAARCP